MPPPTCTALPRIVIANRCAHRCGERIERCRWQRKRDERVAAVKILSGRRKAAPKFWAPQQDPPALRVRDTGCGASGTSRTPSPTGALLGDVRTGRCGHRPLQKTCRAGPVCPAVGGAERVGRRHTWVPPYRGISKGAVKRGVGDADPYGCITNGAVRLGGGVRAPRPTGAVCVGGGTHGCRPTGDNWEGAANRAG